jgi:pimeloyl-ACP methyl ester carboxylesterase
MANTEYRTGSIKSGDVELAFHAYGKAGGETPLLIMHGTNYYDSTDWLEVAGTLASDREVVTFDHRGFGQSGWSACKDYSVDAFMVDVQNVIAHFGWKKPIIFGHSMSGRLVTFFAANFPDHLSRLIIADSGFDHGAPGTYNVSVGNDSMIFDNVEAAMAHFAKLANPPRIAHDRARAEKALRKVDDGYMLLRDPDYRNTQDQTPGADMPVLRDLDAMEELRKVQCPTIIIRGLRSTRYPPEILEPLQKEFPDIAWGTVDSEHDIAVGAPDELVAVVRRFIGAD